MTRLRISAAVGGLCGALPPAGITASLLPLGAVGAVALVIAPGCSVSRPGLSHFNALLQLPCRTPARLIPARR